MLSEGLLWCDTDIKGQWLVTVVSQTVRDREVIQNGLANSVCSGWHPALAAVEGLQKSTTRAGWTLTEALGLLQTVACLHLPVVWCNQPVCQRDVVDYYGFRAGGNSHLFDHAVLLLVRH